MIENGKRYSVPGFNRHYASPSTHMIIPAYPFPQAVDVRNSLGCDSNSTTSSNSSNSEEDELGSIYRAEHWRRQHIKEDHTDGREYMMERRLEVHHIDLGNIKGLTTKITR